MKQGDVVLVELVQADGHRKRRPALLLKLMPKYNDWPVCGISSQINKYLEEFDVILDKDHPDFSTSGLLAPSLIRLGFLAVIPDRRIPGVIESISKIQTHILLKRLSEYLVKGI